jgi:hypothetical protein
MKLRGVAHIVFLVGSVWGCLSAAALPQAKQRWYSFGTTPNEDAVLKYLRPALNSAGKAGRLYYRGACQQESGDPIPFPLIETRLPSRGETGLAAVREIFQNDKDVTVTEGLSGIIRIRIAETSTEILETKISLLTLNRMEQYNPGDAISAIERTKEVEAAMRKFGLRLPLNLGGLESLPTNMRPHLSPSMKNVTVDQALDSIAKTFRGIVVYGECAEPAEPGGARLFDIDFAAVADR